MRTASRHLYPLLLPLGRRTAGWLVGAAFPVGLICWFFGLDAWRASLAGCSVTVAGLVLMSGSSAVDSNYLDGRAGRHERLRGSRSDVASLASALHPGWGYVDVVAHERLQSLVRRRLLFEGLDLDRGDQQSAIERRLGAESYGVLTGRHGRMSTLRELLNCLDALDSIDSTQAAALPALDSRRAAPQ